MSSSNSKLQPGNKWPFKYVDVDRHPLATYRLNDIQLGDIDKDGKLDIWVTGRGAGKDAYQMAWYRNPEWTRYPIATGDYKYGDLGDVDGDGDLDVVVDQYWFENDGNPKKINWKKHDLGHGIVPDSLRVGDINADGRLDAVIATKKELWWLPGPEEPRNKWKINRIYKEMKGRRTGVTLADIDRDGDLDILYGNAWFENPGDDSGVSWRKHMIDPEWPPEARGIVTDLDGDGLPDVVLSDEEGGKGVAWFKGPLDPKTDLWKKQVIATQYSGIHSLQSGDFNRDGKPDIFLAEMHTHGQHRVSIIESIDISRNLWAEHIIAKTGSHLAKIGDLDGDGDLDIVGKNFEGSARSALRIDLWLNQIGERSRKAGIGGVLPLDRWKRHIIDTRAQSHAVFVDNGDLNGDSLPDIITGSSWYKNPGSPSGVWERKKIGPGIEDTAAVFDFDGDGDLDILGNQGKIFAWAENRGDGSFTIHRNIAPVKSGGRGDFLQGSKVIRLERGNRLGVVLSWHKGDEPPGEGTQLFRIPVKVTDTWAWEKLSDTTNAEQVAIGDIDGDGLEDIHLGTHWIRQDGGGKWRTFQAVKLDAAKVRPDRVALADIDGDGDLDVVIACEHGKRLVWGECPADPTSSWHEHLISTDYLLMSMDVGDLDGDGVVDIVGGEHKGRGRAVVFENEGSGEIWKVHDVDAGDYPGLDHHDGTRLIDIDNDGDLDIVSIGWRSRILVLYENLAIIIPAVTEEAP
jgi:hypothetical protein